MTQNKYNVVSEGDIMKRGIYIYIMIMIAAASIMGALSVKAESGTTGVVFSVHGEYLTKTDEDIYTLSDIELLYSDEENNINYYSAKAHYDMKKYTIDDIIQAMELSPIFEDVSEDSVMCEKAFPSILTDSYIDKEWYLDAIGAQDAWRLLSDTPGKGVTVAVIDSGIYYKHRDLKNNIWNLNVAGNLNDIIDEDGHGTHVSGIIAMSAFNGGGAGVAYGADIMPIKAGGSDGKFLISKVIKALGYAVDNGADIINMSFGAENESAVFKSALYKASKDHVLVASAGNDSIANDDSDLENAQNIYPAAYPFVIGVMASDEKNNITSWSDYDTVPFSVNEYEIAAPGANILSTYYDGNYKYMSGTSMSAPVVSGAAALLWQYAEEKGIQDKAGYVCGQLRHATTHKASLTDSNGDRYEYNLLNIYDALTTEPGIDTRISDFIYVDGNNSTYFTDDITICDDGRTNIFCGFDVYNTWGAVKDVSVIAETDAKGCSIISEKEHSIGSMDYNQRITIDCDNYEATVISFEGEPGHKYEIPIKYTVTATAADNKNITLNRQYTDTIYVTVPKKQEQVIPAKNNGSNNVEQVGLNVSFQTENISIPKIKGIKGKRKSSLKNVIKWKSADGVDKYIIYYAGKRNGKYKKLAVTKKRRYVHRITKNKKYYYKVRGIATKSSGKKIYSPFSKVIKL